jgi:hypothetical protein
MRFAPTEEVTTLLDIVLIVCKIGGIAAAISIGAILFGIAIGKVNV